MSEGDSSEAGSARHPAGSRGAAAQRKLRRSRVLRWLGRVALAILVLTVLFLAATRTGRYLVRAAWEEAWILARRQSIVELVADPATDARTREKLQLVLEARGFAQDSLQLLTRESFTQYTALQRDTLVLLLSAAEQDRLRARTWWFPIVGRVPYKGFFDFERAHAEASSLDARGYDTYLRPVSAFSTLGWFNDPLLSTTLRLDSLDLANTVIHELLHNSFYAPGQAVFNESFANFVGARGAERFFLARGDSASARRVLARWHDERLLGRFWSRVYAELDSAFDAHPGRDAAARAARLDAREVVYGRMRSLLIDSIGPQFQARDPTFLPRTRFDNALLLARRIYMTDLDVFERVYALEARDLQRSIDRIIELAQSAPRDPYEAVRGWVDRGRIGGGGAGGLTP